MRNWMSVSNWDEKGIGEWQGLCLVVNPELPPQL